MKLFEAETQNGVTLDAWSSKQITAFVKHLNPSDLGDEPTFHLVATHFIELLKPVKDAAIALASTLRKDVTARGDRSPKHVFKALKEQVHSFYDLQEIRMQVAGRTYPRPESLSIQLHAVDIIKMHEQVQELGVSEAHALKEVNVCLQEIPFYNEVLSNKALFKGIGPTMAGVILSEFDITREPHVSNMWSFAGLAPNPVFRCVKCHTPLKEGEVEGVSGVVYLHKTKTEQSKACDAFLTIKDIYPSGETAKAKKGEPLKYNAWLRSKLCGVLGPVLLKCNSPWRKHYDDYKHRKQTAGWGMSDLHRHNAAIRYMIKMLLLDIWVRWRTFEKLPITPSYHEAKQGGHGYPTKLAQELVEPPEDPRIAEELAQL